MTTLARSPDVLWRAVADALIVATPHHAPLVISGSAPTVWVLLEQPCGLEQLAQDLADIFGEQPNVVLTALRPVIDDLLHRGVLIEVDS